MTAKPDRERNVPGGPKQFPWVGKWDTLGMRCAVSKRINAPVHCHGREWWKGWKNRQWLAVFRCTLRCTNPLRFVRCVLPFNPAARICPMLRPCRLISLPSRSRNLRRSLTWKNIASCRSPRAVNRWVRQNSQPGGRTIYCQGRLRPIDASGDSGPRGRKGARFFVPKIRRRPSPDYFERR